MKRFNQTDINQLLSTNHVNKRLQKNLRYSLDTIEWENLEFITLTTKQDDEGVLLFDTNLVEFSLQKRRASVSGRVEAIICDLCVTWQSGPRSAVLTLKRSDHTASFLVCADLECSQHVRDLTSAAKTSRSQLREHLTVEDRIERLQNNLQRILG